MIDVVCGLSERDSTRCDARLVDAGMRSSRWRSRRRKWMIPALTGSDASDEQGTLNKSGVCGRQEKVKSGYVTKQMPVFSRSTAQTQGGLAPKHRQFDHKRPRLTCPAGAFSFFLLFPFSSQRLQQTPHLVNHQSILSPSYQQQKWVARAEPVSFDIPFFPKKKTRD